MDRTPDQASAPPGWIEALEESDADLAAGRVVPMAALKAELRESIARLEAQGVEDDEEPSTGAASGPAL